MLDVGLYWLGALRGLCGFCVRERLGGLEACCVFAPVFHLLPISFCLPFYLFAPALLWLSFACSLLFAFALFVSLWLFVRWWCCFFPFGCTDKKKGRAVLVRPLLSCCGLV